MSFMEDSSTTETSFVTQCDAKESSITQSHETRSTLEEQSKPPEFETYNYDPLPKQCGAIRLLKLVPSKSTDPDVECELITPTKEERETHGYEALSWCWDTEQKTRYLNIRQGGRIYAKYVSPNLHSALRALRRGVDSRFLWIDAICINEEDLDEKNHQVEMMHDIYGNADRVCVWLGEQSKSSRLALRFIKEDVLQLEHFDEQIPCQHTSRKWLALVELMQRPWFSRRCSVQEIALAQTAVLYCGRDRIPWRRFAIAVGLIINAESTTHWLSEALKKATQCDPPWFDSISSLGASLLVDATEQLFSRWSYSTEEDEQSESEESWESWSSDSMSEVSSSAGEAISMVKKTTMQPLLSLEYLVSKLATFETTVPHDTIYALLAIAKDTAPRAALMNTLHLLDHSQPGSELSVSRVRYNVDYKIPYVDVCKEFIQFCIKNTPHSDRCRALDVICRPWAMEEKKLAEWRNGEQKEVDETVKLHNNEGNHHAKEESQNSTASSINNEPAVSSSTGISEHIDLPLPSWVPQLDRAPFGMHQPAGLVGPSMIRKNANPLVGHPSPAQCKYSAAATLKIDMKALKFRKRSGITPPHYSMYTRGFHLDTIHDVQQVARDGEIPKEWIEFGGWPAAKGSPPGALWRTLVADRGRDARNPPLYYSRALEGIFAKEEMMANLIQHDNNPVVHEFCKRVQAVTWNRALVRTERRTLGLVSQNVEIGDMVCILYGCSVPVILRKSARKPEDVLAVEIQWELELAARTIVRCYKRYNERKKQHQRRKNAETARIYRQWLGESSWLHMHKTSGVEGLGKNKETLEAALRAKIENVLLGFRSWYYDWTIMNRRREWRDVTWRRMIEEAAKEHKCERAKRKREKWIRSTGIGKQNETATEDDKDDDNDDDNATDSDEYSDELAHELERQRPKGPRPPFDWRQFEIELKFGRRWMNIVRDARARMLSAALRNRKMVRQERTLARQNEQPRQQVAVGTEVNWDPTPGAFRPSRPSKADLLVVDVKASADQPLPQDTTEPVIEHHKLAIDPEPPLTPLQKRRLTEAQREDYDSTVFHNLREKLGEEGYYSYTLLGECYIHGMMDGEAIQYQNEWGLPSTVFEIR